ncbi:MAG TPA: ATP-binding protein [Candidatus Aminicenantes bacterium]|nr:ATP-binding protein [Candidatus Aminicenantes bacterium]
MKRYLEPFVVRDLAQKIVFLSGPRQVGKTTLARQLINPHAYLNFDSAHDRKMIQDAEWDRSVPLVVFDELHKKKKWKSWIKGAFDTEGIPPGLLVTGSARLDTYRKGDDSLAGRFFHYRLHPLSVAEIVRYLETDPQKALDGILATGGFCEVYLRGEETFARRWRRSHLDTIVRQDLMDLNAVRDIKAIEILIDLLRDRVGSTVSFSSLARDLEVSVQTVKHWLTLLESLYVIFPVRPYHKQISRSILKAAKYYFFDTGAVKNEPGARLENAVATALLKEAHFLEDTLGHRMQLCYLRDKEKREVDFLVVRDGKPEKMIEVKLKEESFSPSLFYFSRFFQNIERFQVVYALRRARSKDGAVMHRAAEFLAGLKA